MAYCKVCGTQTDEGVDICSVKCRRLLSVERKRAYDRKKIRQRIDVKRSCEVCGVRLRHLGKRCAKHRRVGKHARKGAEAPAEWD